MYRRLLVAVDDAGVAGGTLVALAGLARGWEASVHVLHLHAPGEAGRNRACRRLVTDLVARLTAAAVRATGEALLVDEALSRAAIGPVAARTGADLVAVTGGVGLARGETAGLPVLLLPEPDPQMGGRPARVAVADGDERWPALLDAAAWTVAGSGEVVVVRVLGDAEAPDRGQASLGAAVRRLHGRRVCARGLLVATGGGPAAQLADAAERVDAGVVVVGSQRLALELGHRTGRPVLVAAGPGPGGGDR
jgi:nucleotide-binding universal stress UspA family protein